MPLPSIRLFAASGLVALAPGYAVAAPVAPRLLTPEPPAFTLGDRVTLNWEQATFSANTVQRAYVVRVRDDSTGVDLPEVALPVTARSHEVTGLQDGKVYLFQVVARERPCPDAACATPGAPQEAGSVVLDTRMDAGLPTGGVAINGGAEFTRSAEVTLNLTATDPAPAGATASGVTGVQISDTGLFSCDAQLLITPDCPVVFAPAVPAQLFGADGTKTVWARFRDGARPWNAPSLGNGSAVVSDTIVLDRVPPNTALSLTAAPEAGRVRLTASAAATDLTSGVDATTASWSFGDGSTAAGLTAAHTYAAAGVYAGVFTVKDRAGNVGTQNFTVTVTGTSAPTVSQGPPATTSSTTTTPPPEALSASPEIITTPPPAPTGAISSVAATAPRSPVRIVGARVVGAVRAGGIVVVRTNLRTRGPLRVAIVRALRGTTKTLRWASVSAAGPGQVITRLKAPTAGRYFVVVSAGASTTRLPLLVRRAG